MVAVLEHLWFRFGADEEGQGLVEYALILGLIVVVAIAAVVLLGGRVQGIFSGVATAIPTP